MDGAWAIGIDDGPYGFRIYWGYPFSARSHVWDVGPDGVRLGGHDLSSAETAAFLKSHFDLGLEYRVKLLTLALEKDGLASLSELLPQFREEMIVENIELARLCCAFPQSFEASWVNRAKRAVEVHVRETLCEYVRNPASAAARLAPLRAFSGLAEESVSAKTFDLTIALGEHITPEMPVAPHRVQLSFSETEAQFEILSHTGVEGFIFKMSEDGSPDPLLIINHDQPFFHRFVFSISYMNFLIKRYLSEADGFRCSDGLVCSGVFLSHDTPPELDIHAVAFERPVGTTRITLIPDLYFFNSGGYREIKQGACRGSDWTSRRRQFLWRGSTTGFLTLDMHVIDALPRLRLCRKGLLFPGIVDAGFVSVVQAPSAAVHTALEDYLKSSGLWREYMPQNQMTQYRYQLEIDGNANPWGLLVKLLSGSCILKVDSPWEQWFYNDLRPWRHYVPIAGDLSDYEDKIEWCLAHDKECEQIALEGRQFAMGLEFEKEMSAAARRIRDDPRFFGQGRL